MHPKAGPLAALAAVNPALAIVPFLEPGKKQEADCDKLIAEARAKGEQTNQKVAAS